MRGPPEHPNEPGTITRREFAVGSACAVGSLAAGACLGSTGPSEPTARVAAVRGANLDAMTRDVLDGLGGIGTVVGEGETVFIKPNMVTLPGAEQSNPFTRGECTKPEIVVAVAEECMKAGAAEVVIGDGSHQPVLRWDLATTLDGSTNLAQEAARLTAAYGRPVRVASLEVDSPAWVEVSSDTYLGTIAVSSLVANADRVISVPVAKTHAWAQLTLALKNFIGVTPFTRYGVFANGYWDRGKEFDHSSTAAIAAIYLDIVKGIKPDLAIVDFSIGVEGDGPTLGHGGRPVDMKERLGSWLLLASTDLVAADATAARIMSHDPVRMTQLRMGYEMGLGEIRGERIELVGERLDDLRVAWSPARLRNRLAANRGGCPVRGPVDCARTA